MSKEEIERQLEMIDKKWKANMDEIERINQRLNERWMENAIELDENFGETNEDR